MRNARRNNNHISLTNRLLDAPRIILMPKAQPSFTMGYTEDFVRRRLQMSSQLDRSLFVKIRSEKDFTHMKMAATVHRIPPLRLHDADRTQMLFDLAGGDIGRERGLVDQQGLVLDRSVWR
jgi:hypothetical protein